MSGSRKSPMEWLLLIKLHLALYVALSLALQVLKWSLAFSCVMTGHAVPVTGIKPEAKSSVHLRTPIDRLLENGQTESKQTNEGLVGRWLSFLQ